jgi:uncharacterized protein YjbJ (UPF0337 family)
MNSDRIQGAATEMKGKVLDAAGNVMGDAQTQARGKINEAAGQLQNRYGAAVDSAQDIAETITERVREQPLTAVLIAAGIGYLIGRIGRYI